MTLIFNVRRITHDDARGHVAVNEEVGSGKLGTVPCIALLGKQTVG